MGFVLAFIALFVAAGVGNGSTFRMIPIIFRTLREREVKDRATRMRWRRPAASAPPKAPRHWDSVRPSRRSAWLHPDRLWHVDQPDGQPVAALIFFSVFYLSRLLGTWHWYARRGAEVPCSDPQLDGFGKDRT